MKRKQASMAALASVVFILDGLMIAGCWIQTQSAQQRVESTHRLIEQLENIESLAQSLGSYIRRYVSSGDQVSVEDFHKSEAKLQSELEGLVPLFRKNEQDRLYLVRLRNFIGQRLEWEEKIISVYRSQGKEQALALIQTRGGAGAMEAIRAQVADKENSEQIVLQKYSADYELYRTGSLLAILLLTIAGGIALWQAIKMSDLSARLEADRVLAYEDLERLNKQLNKQVSELLTAQKNANNALTIRSEFLARVSHELRTPLNGVIGATELALQTPLGQDERELIEIANESGNRLLELVNDILDFEKLEQHNLQLEPAVFDLPLAIKSAVEPFRMRAKEKGISFRIDLAPQTPHLVYSDRLRIQQVLVNLTDNATKFTNQGGVSVAVSVDEKDLTRAIVCFAVTDTGIGIDSLLLDQIWEPFDQADGSSTRDFGGSGLGLSIGKKLVELLHGQIGVTSSPGKGSKFFFKVPLELGDASSGTVPKALPKMPEQLSR